MPIHSDTSVSRGNFLINFRHDPVYCAIQVPRQVWRTFFGAVIDCGSFLFGKLNIQVDVFAVMDWQSANPVARPKNSRRSVHSGVIALWLKCDSAFLWAPQLIDWLLSRDVHS